MTHLHLFLLPALLAIPAARAAESGWVHLSSAKGDLPVPGESPQQTGLLAARIDPKGATDFILSFRVKGPALVWYRRAGNAWKRYVIEPEFLRVEAGGAAYDIDGDGDLDVVFGGDGQVNQLWWWENPYPDFDPDKPWQRHVIKNTGANQQHDQVFGDFLGLGKAQLAFWNQKAKTLFIARIPADPRANGPWPLETVFSGQAGENVENAAKYAEGIDAFSWSSFLNQVFVFSERTLVVLCSEVTVLNIARRETCKYRHADQPSDKSAKCVQCCPAGNPAPRH